MLKRMWINQPSKAQPLHDLHGTCVLGHPDGDNCTRIYFLKGPVIDMRVMTSCLSDGWPDHLNNDRSGWRLQLEANRFWSVYHGEAFRKGGFHSKAKAQAWMDDYRGRMAEVGAD